MRHILVIRSTYDWNITHPRGFGNADTVDRHDAVECARVQLAAIAFMEPPPLRPAATLRERARRLLGREPLPVKIGAYWVDLIGGNLAIGGRLEPAAELVHTGRLA